MPSKVNVYPDISSFWDELPAWAFALLLPVDKCYCVSNRTPHAVPPFQPFCSQCSSRWMCAVGVSQQFRVFAQRAASDPFLSRSRGRLTYPTHTFVKEPSQECSVFAGTACILATQGIGTASTCLSASQHSGPNYTPSSNLPASPVVTQPTSSLLWIPHCSIFLAPYMS